MNKVAKKIVFKKDKKRYRCLLWKGSSNNDIAVVYFHGLNGKAKMVHPLLKALSDFDFYSFEQRGHINSHLKASTSIHKHVKDIKDIVLILKQRYKKIFLCGESMGALYVSLYGYKNNDVNSVFAWSIPFEPKNIMKENKKTKLLIYLRIVCTFLFQINFKYSAKINYPKLTNSKLLKKLYELDVPVKGSSAEEIAIWKASLKVKRLFLSKEPKSHIYYWQGDDDIMSNSKLLNKIKERGYVLAQEVKESKHILMYENNFDLIAHKIEDVIINSD